MVDTDRYEGRERATDECPRFVVDQMLGQLARWLRLLGYDAVYSNRLDDPELARLSQAEDRILLTRDRELARRRRVRAILIESDQPAEQMAQMVHELRIHPVAPLSRCLVCNAPLAAMEREAARDRVPPYVYATQRQFSCCPGCDRIYWPGTHWHSMRDAVERLSSR